MSQYLKCIKCGAPLERPNRHPRATCEDCKKVNQDRINRKYLDKLKDRTNAAKGITQIAQTT